MTISIGVHIQAGCQRLPATLASLSAHTASPHSLLLWGDSAEHEIASAIQDSDGAYACIAQSSTPDARGAPACFNRLTRDQSADIYILLESGALVTPGWLEAILAAFENHPECGLCGPSTNRAWNEQCVFPGLKDSAADLAQAANRARQRFGNSCRPLDPLHSLSDFCYAVRRQVIAAIGDADEGYGLGPCWEMDYNIRAARAGFAGLWVCGAYVHRSPFNPPRRRREAALFSASKRKYQDKFCGLRLRGMKHDYRDHCRGDACSHFAPASLIQLRDSTAPIVSLATSEEIPLVSCIMPTFNRRAFISLALASFHAQTWASKELIVVDDGDDSIQDLVDGIPHVRYFRLNRRMTIGAKRNIACEEARGEFIAHWDDDDWYSPTRLVRQMEPLLADTADLTGMVNSYVLEMPTGQFWNTSADVHRRMFAGDIHGGTIVFGKEIWQMVAKYPNVSLAEDAALIKQAIRRGKRIHRVENGGEFVYIRHSTNTWRFQPGSLGNLAGWHRISAPPEFSAEKLEAYRSASSGASLGSLPAGRC